MPRQPAASSGRFVGRAGAGAGFAGALDPDGLTRTGVLGGRRTEPARHPTAGMSSQQSHRESPLTASWALPLLVRSRATSELPPKVAVRSSSLKNTQAALEEAGALLRQDLAGEADLVLCFCTANASRHVAEHVLEHAHIVVGTGMAAIPFAANSSYGMLSRSTDLSERTGYPEMSAKEERGAALVLWALRDPLGTFAVSGVSEPIGLSWECTGTAPPPASKPRKASMAETSLVRQRSYKNNSEADRARFAEELEGAGLSEELIAARLNIGVKKSQAESSFSLVSAEEARRAALELRAEECPDLARLLNLIGDKDPRGNLCDGVLCCNGSVDDPFSRGHWDAIRPRRRILPQGPLAIPKAGPLDGLPMPVTLDSYIKVNGRYYKPEVGDKMAKEMGSRAASQAVQAGARQAKAKGRPPPKKVMLWALSAPGKEEKVMEGIGAAVDSLLPDTPTQLLGTTSADNSPLDNFSWSWQCDGQNDHDGGVVVVYLAPSVNFQCVFKHSCEGGDGSTTLLGRAAVARTAEVTKFEEDQRTIGRLERPRGYEAVLAQRTIDRPTPKAPKSTSSREIETLRDARGRERPAAEVYDEWTGGRVALHDVPAVVLARGPDGVDGVNILQASSRFPLLVTKPGGKQYLVHPSMVDKELHLHCFGSVEVGDTVEVLETSGVELLTQVAMINEDLKAEIARAEQQSGKQQAVMGSLCFFCAGSKTAVFQDDDLKDGLGQAFAEVDQDKSGQIDFEEFCSLVRRTEPHLRHTTAELRRRFDEVDADKGGTIDAAEFEDPITHPADAMLSAFGAATQRMPFALVHPFGEQGWRVYSGGRRDPSEPKPQHSNLSFGALIFFTDSKDVRKAVSDVPSQDRIPAKEVWAAIEREKREQCCTFNFVPTERVLTLDPYGDPQRHVRELQGLEGDDAAFGPAFKPLTISFAELMRANADPRTPLTTTHLYMGAKTAGPALRADELLVVSHRWAAKELPYNGDEIYRLQEYLRSTGTIVEGKNVYEKKFVWLDYWCGSPRGLTPRVSGPRVSPHVSAHLPPTASLRSLPQKSCAHVCTELGELNEADAMRFGWSLANANMLYLGLPVLLVVDDEYARRFWTLFEAWCSAQLVRPDGGFAAPSGRSMSAAPRQIVLAADNSGADRTALAFGRMAEKDARAALAKREVLVTNQGDKIVSFAKMRRLGIRAKEEKRRSSRDGYGEERRSSREPPLPAAGGGSRPYGGAGGFRYY